MSQVAHQLTGNDFESAENHSVALDFANVLEIDIKRKERNQYHGTNKQRLFIMIPIPISKR